MDAIRCIENVALLVFIFVLLYILFGMWLNGLDEHAREMFEKSLKERDDGSYERYIKAKEESERNQNS